MGEIEHKVRGLLVYESKRRPSEIGIDATGRPVQKDLVAALGIDKSTVSKIMTGRFDHRPGVENPRSEEWEPDKETLDGIQRWLNLRTRGDVWSRIQQAEPCPRFPVRKVTRSDRGRAGSRKKAAGSSIVPLPDRKRRAQ